MRTAYAIAVFTMILGITAAPVTARADGPTAEGTFSAGVRKSTGGQSAAGHAGKLRLDWDRPGFDQEYERNTIRLEIDHAFARALKDGTGDAHEVSAGVHLVTEDFDSDDRLRVKAGARLALEKDPLTGSRAVYAAVSTGADQRIASGRTLLERGFSLEARMGQLRMERDDGSVVHLGRNGRFDRGIPMVLNVAVEGQTTRCLLAGEKRDHAVCLGVEAGIEGGIVMLVNTSFRMHAGAKVEYRKYIAESDESGKKDRPYVFVNAVAEGNAIYIPRTDDAAEGGFVGGAAGVAFGRAGY